jgi:hypothetical protein
MKIMYVARMARPDLLRAIPISCLFLTTWTEDSDRRPHRLILYIHASYAYRMYARCGDSLEGMPLGVYSDAGYAGCAEAQRSTTGSIVILNRPDMSVPISFISKRHGCVSRSTAEAEIVAMDSSLRLLTMLVLSIVKELFPNTRVRVFGDNQSMLAILKTGRSPTMRHLSRTHRVSIAWLHEQNHRNNYDWR